MKKSLKYKIVLAIVIIVCIMDVSFIFVIFSGADCGEYLQTGGRWRQRNGLSGQQTEKYGLLRGME